MGSSGGVGTITPTRTDQLVTVVVPKAAAVTSANLRIGSPLSDPESCADCLTLLRGGSRPVKGSHRRRSRGGGGRTSRRRTLEPQRVPARTNCWCDPTLCLVIRSDKQRTLTESRRVAVVRKGLPTVAPPTTGTLFGCGAPRRPSHPAFRNTLGRRGGRTSRRRDSTSGRVGELSRSCYGPPS
jgi:hypothetical protein